MLKSLIEYKESYVMMYELYHSVGNYESVDRNTLAVYTNLDKAIAAVEEIIEIKKFKIKERKTYGNGHIVWTLNTVNHAYEHLCITTVLVDRYDIEDI